MIKTLFLDRDGIITEVVMRGTLVSSARTLSEFRIREDFRKFYERIRDRFTNVFVISNQPDVSRRLLPTATLQQMTDELLRQFSFTEIVYCTHDDKDECECRKPQPGMILGLLEKYHLQRDEAIIIGDSYKDILAGQAAGIQTIYRRHSYNSAISCEPDFVVTKLTDICSLPLFQPWL